MRKGTRHKKRALLREANELWKEARKLKRASEEETVRIIKQLEEFLSSCGSVVSGFVAVKRIRGIVEGVVV